MNVGQLNGVIRRIHRLASLQGDGACSDAHLLDRFIGERDERAFELLLERHGPMVFGVCQRILHRTQDAEDAFQATFLVFMRKASSIRPREMVGNWLYGVACRTALKARAVAAKRAFKEKQGTHMNRQAPAPGDVWSDVQTVLDEELERLSDKYRTLIVLCDLEGKTRKEVAQKLQLAEGTLSSRLATARKLLAERLRKRGVTLSAGALASVISHNVASATVPTALSASTIHAVHVLAAGGASAGVISPGVAALSEGVIKAMLLTKLKTILTMVLAVGVFAGGILTLTSSGVSAQPTGAKKEALPAAKDAQPEKPGEKKALPKVPARTAQPKKPADPYPFDDLKGRLKKHEDEIAKLRQVMLKEIADEEKKLDEAIKKEKDAQKTGDRDAFGRAARLQSKKLQLNSLRFHVQSGQPVLGRPPVPKTEEQRLGIYVASPSSIVAKQLALTKNQGMVLERVDADSPAAKAGLMNYDILLKIDGKAVTNDRREFHKLLTEIKTDTPVEAVILRAGKQQTIQGLAIPATSSPAVKAPTDPKAK